MIQKDINLSNNKVLKMAENIRVSTGSRKIIEKDMKGKLRKLNHTLEDLFKTEKCTFVFENKAEKIKINVEQHVVFCKDLNNLINIMIEERNLNENDIIIRIGHDGGGGFVKICLSVFKLDSEEEGDEGGQEEKKRLTQRFQDSGVKKAMVVACVPDIQENYYNIKRLWVESGIDKLTRKFTIATDLKLCNILLGLMSHSSSHPCSWCDVSKDELKQRRFKNHRESYEFVLEILGV